MNGRTRLVACGLASLAVLAFGGIARGDPIIVVDPAVYPAEHNLGNVEVGASSTTIITITNVGGHPLTISALFLVDPISGEYNPPSDFTIVGAPATPFYVSPSNPADPMYPGPMSVSFEVVFAPSKLGYQLIGVVMAGNDPFNCPAVVQLSGVGVPEEPPEEVLAEILNFFDTSVASGHLTGSGPGNSAQGRLKALRNMIEAAGHLIEDGYFEQALQQLQDAYKKCDGLPKPPDFVQGAARAVLAGMIQDLISQLGG